MFTLSSFLTAASAFFAGADGAVLVPRGTDPLAIGPSGRELWEGGAPGPLIPDYLVRPSARIAFHRERPEQS